MTLVHSLFTKSSKLHSIINNILKNSIYLHWKIILMSFFHISQFENTHKIVFLLKAFVTGDIYHDCLRELNDIELI